MPVKSKAGKGLIKVFGIGKRSKSGARSHVVTIPKKNELGWGEGEILSYFIVGDKLVLQRKKDK